MQFQMFQGCSPVIRKTIPTQIARVRNHTLYQSIRTFRGNIMNHGIGNVISEVSGVSGNNYIAGLDVEAKNDLDC